MVLQLVPHGKASWHSVSLTKKVVDNGPSAYYPAENGESSSRRSDRSDSYSLKKAESRRTMVRTVDGILRKEGTGNSRSVQRTIVSAPERCDYGSVEGQRRQSTVITLNGTSTFGHTPKEQGIRSGDKSGFRVNFTRVITAKIPFIAGNGHNRSDE